MPSHGSMGVTKLWFGGPIWLAGSVLTHGPILVTYLSEINNTIFDKISSYLTKLQYTNIIQ